MSLEKPQKRTFLPSRPSSSSSSSTVKNGSVVKKCSRRPNKIRKSQVIKTFSIMDQEKNQQQQQNPAGAEHCGATEDEKNEFFNTGRIGRRNAMPDILGNNCTASSGGDLPLKLSALTTNESSSSQQTNETPSQTTTKK